MYYCICIKSDIPWNKISKLGVDSLKNKSLLQCFQNTKIDLMQILTIGEKHKVESIGKIWKMKVNLDLL